MKMTKGELFEYAKQVLGLLYVEEWLGDIHSGIITTKDQIDQWTPR